MGCDRPSSDRLLEGAYLCTPSMRWNSDLPALFTTRSLSLTVRSFSPYCSNSCPIITFQHENVSSVADATLPGLASANPLTTFEQSNIRVSFLYDSALGGTCEAVGPATRVCLACFRYRVSRYDSSVPLAQCHDAISFGEATSRPCAYAAPERPPSSFWGYVGYWPSSRCFCLLLFL